MTRHICSALLCATTLFLAHGPSSAEDVTTTQDAPIEVQVLGWVENAWLVAPGFQVKAKLDTGANTSSLDARIIKRFRKDGKRWVRFALRHPDTGEETVLVRERVRTIGIVQHEGENDVRPTVQVEMCIAGVRRQVEVSLADRSNFRYPLLLGRRSLQGLALVDSSETFLASAPCETQAVDG